MAHLLLIDDDELLIPELVRHAFPSPAYRVEVAATGRAGMTAIQRETPDAVLLDLHLPDGSGLDIYQRIRAHDARIPVVFITTASTADTAIEAMKQGAYDYLHKPLDLAELRRVVGEALEVSRMRAPVVLTELLPDPATEGTMLGASKPMLEIYKAIGRVASQDVPVLITGESGTGKELVARAICQHSARASGPFLALNCAAIPESLLESELFGHEKGAFTGADRRRIGKFEQCNGGTILLDEIGDVPIQLQAKLLRLLQEQTFERVGGNETIRTDVRILASTHRDLKARITSEQFRADLYYRLGVFTIHMPPLRERADDVLRLANYFVQRFSRAMGREVRELAPDARARLVDYSWPGNIRELQNVLRQALLHSSGTVLLSAFLPELGTMVPTRTATFDLPSFIDERLAPGTSDLSAEAHREVDRMLFTKVLAYTNGNHRDAAKVLGISRQTLRVRMRALGLYVAHSVESDDD